MVCPHGQRGLSQCGHIRTKKGEGVNFSQFCADFLYGRPLVFYLYVNLLHFEHIPIERHKMVIKFQYKFYYGDRQSSHFESGEAHRGSDQHFYNKHLLQY